MKRTSQKIPAYDAIYGECDCGKPRPCGHGICGERWGYIVTSDDGQVCLGLTVHTDIEAATLPADHSLRCGVMCKLCGCGDHRSVPCSPATSGRAGTKCNCPALPLDALRWGSDLTCRTSFPTSDEGYGKHAEFAFPFEWSTGSSVAREFFKVHGDPRQFEQPESFWVALEAELARQEAEARAKRIDHLVPCGSCGRRGLVEKDRFFIDADPQLFMEAVGAEGALVERRDDRESEDPERLAAFREAAKNAADAWERLTLDLRARARSPKGRI